MTEGWRYRDIAVLGTTSPTATADVVVNQPPVLTVVNLLTVLRRLPTDGASGGELTFEAATATTTMVATLMSLNKHRPRRILDSSMRVVHRTVLALLALATIGYFDYTYQHSQLTLIVSCRFGMSSSTCPQRSDDKWWVRMTP